MPGTAPGTAPRTRTRRAPHGPRRGARTAPPRAARPWPAGSRLVDGRGRLLHARRGGRGRHLAEAGLLEPVVDLGVDLGPLGDRGRRLGAAHLVAEDLQVLVPGERAVLPGRPDRG